MNARGAERDSSQRFLNPAWNEGSLCWRDSVSVVPPSAVACVAFRWSAYASTLPFIKARAQHALAADAASRQARSCLFQRRYLLQCDYHVSVAAPLKRNPFGVNLALALHVD